MTAYLRTSGGDRTVHGQAFVQENHIVLFLLAIQIGFTIIFLAAVIFHTERLGIDIVKSSNMAELFALQDTLEQEAKFVGINPRIDNNATAELTRRNGVWKLDLR
ncbi:unnamed protein product [Clonostachys chloroleuca]|uniref:Uncharacterized protein n=1 Tax=Clonostachys chloroleuca TaxID=1926264 RepID=A0AA35VC28_9HYPO|nr:unnamed protein product [Clonostachys chloroleuca]